MSAPLPLTTSGEIASFPDANQFQAAKTQFACGFFATAIARAMAKVGQKPTMTEQQIIDAAESWYAQYDGDNSLSNTDGMSVEQLYRLLVQVGLHYQAIATDINQIKAWVRAGYPVILAVPETTVYDLSLARNPYTSWTPAGNHIIVVTGVLSSGNLLVRDSANCTDLNNPNSLRPGPRIYSPSLQVLSATVVVPPWRPRPASATPPTSIQEIPAGWADNGTILCASNGVPVANEFRNYILNTANAWNPGDVAQGPEQSANPVELGWQQRDGNNAGTRQVFQYSELCRTSTRSTYRASVGREFWTLLQQQPAIPTTPAPGATVSVKAGGGPDPDTVLMNDLRAAARLIGDASNHMLSQLTTWQQQSQTRL